MKIFKRDAYENMLKWKKNNRNPNLRRKVLRLEGNRQVGKTTLAKYFGEKEYKHTLYINLAHRTVSDKINDFIENFNKDNLTLANKFKRYDSEFEDNKDNLIIIDEIQDSIKFYNNIRVFAEELNCDMIVTGSYLGITTMKDRFWESAGDYTSLVLDVLSFEEFLAVFNKRELYDSLDMFGNNNEEGCKIINNYFKAYRKIGGYPEAISTYLATQDMAQVNKVFKNTFEIFCKESEKYLNLDEDNFLFGEIISLLIHNLSKEKKGFNEKEVTVELKQLLDMKYSLTVNTKTITTVLYWLLMAGVIISCSKAIDCDLCNTKLFQRFYLNDLGMMQYLSYKNGIRTDTIQGMISELFIAKSIIRYNNSDAKEINNGNRPSFGTYKDYEIDFILKSSYDNDIYGIEVKTGNNKTTSLDVLLNDNKIKYGIAFKGVLKSNGKLDNNKITIPVMFAEKFKYDLGEKYVDPNSFDIEIPNMNVFD